RVDNVAPAAQIAPRLGSTPTNTLLTADVIEPGLDDVPLLTYLWEVNTGLGGYTTLGTTKNLTFNSTLLGTPLIRLTVSDDDGGSDQYEVVGVFGTDSAETISVTSTGFSRTGAGAGGIGLVPGEGLWSTQILVLGFGGADLLDASALTSGYTAILDGGQQQDYLLGGAGADLFYPNDGNDTVDGGEGSDSYFLKPNSVLTVIDTSGDNVLDFSLAEFGNSSGISFDLTKIRSSGAPSPTLDAQTVSTAGGVSHVVAAYGTFSAVTGSAYSDSLTAASGSVVDGGGGKDRLYVGTGTTNATVSGGADDDILYTTGTGITNLTFSGDEGFDFLRNTGSISGLNFGGGADDDILENVGSILGTLSFGGDDGVDVLTNTGTIGTLVFGGGADDDIFVNNGTVPTTLSFGGDDDILLSGAGFVSNLVFGGDAGADIFANLGTITSLTFTGGADDDVFVNVGTSTSLNFGGSADVLLSNSGSVGTIGTLVFSGDDGADMLRNFGSLGTLNFTGGADDDLLRNYAGATVTTLVFGGDDGADTLWN
ncbi:MAG: beta strand repeat-containing protein, partial [Planctomyces sp.]